MSQVKVTLRPPPNVDFVHGYPGIPPAAPDRPQAEVKGAIEVRVGPQGVKAKWVRVELRKVETLPGGGQASTFQDVVGPGPQSLWQANNEDWSFLRSTDFPFQIRIPESIPPSIALENRAGIKYELLATVCTQGKKSFFRRRKEIVESAVAPIIIDKHELHSTWPVYCQPETRAVSQDGATLTVERSHTCHGPGDRISVVANLKSESLHTIILRGFEIALKESTIFRTGPYASGTSSKKSSPQVRVSTICENRIPINTELYGGTKHRTELSCVLGPNHTTTTLNAARHIDITYVLSVKAIMGTGTFTTITMDLPIMISNWQSVVSQEAVRRIGPVPNLSLVSGSSTPPPNAQTYGGRSSQPESAAVGEISNTYGPNSVTANGSSRVDEFGGYGAGLGGGANTYGTKVSHQANKPSLDEGRRFTVTNTVPGELPAAATASGQRGRKPSVDARPSTANSTLAQRAYLSAEQEKERLYHHAKEVAERSQALAAGGVDLHDSPSPEPTKTSPARNGGSGSSSNWMTAEAEKSALYNKAQAAVQKAQAQGYVSEESTAGASGSKPTSSPAPSQKRPNTGASGSSRYLTAEQEKAQIRRYNDAVQAVSRTVADTEPEEEEDVRGIQPVQGLGGPVPYESLYPAGPAGPAGPSAGGSSQAPAVDDSPSRQMPKDAFTQISEKQKLQRELEARDAATRSRMGMPNGVNGTGSSAVRQSPPPASDSPPPFNVATAGGVGGFNTEGLSEKEILRRRLAQQDAMATGNSAPPPPLRMSSTSPRPAPPMPTPALGGSRPLTAAEEKAMLKAKMEAEDNANRSTPPRVNGHSQYHSTPSRTNSYTALQSTPPQSTSTPPPLAPRPPKDYIVETQKEDERVSKFAKFEPQSRMIQEEEQAMRYNLPNRMNGSYSPGSSSFSPGPTPPPHRS